jgi:PTH1 family peptidyl-tRNA hydrolase
MKLIVGLGTPGKQYVGTRHNVGFDAIDAFAKKIGWIRSAGEFERVSRKAFEGLAMDGNLSIGGAEEKVMLLKPQTFMNLSGRSVASAAGFFRIKPEELMVVLDDLALDCGRLRIRSSGSSGGHNGLKDIERAMGTSQYPRMRIGIGSPPAFIPSKDYVLQRFTDEQRKQVEASLERAAGALSQWMESGIGPAMNRFNASESDKDKKD